ncbi:hypothetical protein [Hymenobacter cellulosivorans]|uniref:Uncharacterized protein n=1 Tax=Hymenobacter cellulosivorans TaxID=2932249 RepID=A0ABY4FD16_9BACT|nr:hypothetical protein [Hymenobacter cellulosivorans]UOQ54562.1 hypothetical protein MUN80_07310 [Hymenobacter cellulosivorans]
MIQSFGLRVMLSCLLQLVLHVLYYEPLSFVALKALYLLIVLANTVALLIYTYQAFQRQRPILAGAAALASFPALLLGILLFGTLLSK